MTDTSQEEMERLKARILELEAKLDDQQDGGDGERGGGEHAREDMRDQFEDAGRKFFEDSTKLFEGIVDASMEVVNEAADALGNMTETMNREKLNDMPGTMFEMMHKAIDIQKKALNKMQERYEQNKV